MTINDADMRGLKKSYYYNKSKFMIFGLVGKESVLVCCVWKELNCPQHVKPMVKVCSVVI